MCGPVAHLVVPDVRPSHHCAPPIHWHALARHERAAMSLSSVLRAPLARGELEVVDTRDEGQGRVLRQRAQALGEAAEAGGRDAGRREHAHARARGWGVARRVTATSRTQATTSQVNFLACMPFLETDTGIYAEAKLPHAPPKPIQAGYLQTTRLPFRRLMPIMSTPVQPPNRIRRPARSMRRDQHTPISIARP